MDESRPRLGRFRPQHVAERPIEHGRGDVPMPREADEPRLGYRAEKGAQARAQHIDEGGRPLGKHAQVVFR